jgi:plastocyanin
MAGWNEEPMRYRLSARRATAVAWGLLMSFAVASCGRVTPPPQVVRPAPIVEPPVGSVAGQISFPDAETPSGEVVVYLEPIRGGPSNASHRSLQIRQKSGKLEPAFLAAGVGDRVIFRNDDEIFHNVFSSSPTQRFDLGLLKRGEHRSIELEHPGVIPLYSSLHEEVSGLIFVAPSRHYAVAEERHFRLDAVPAGRFRLHAWSEAYSASGREVEVPAGGTVTVNLRLEENP